MAFDTSCDAGGCRGGERLNSKQPPDSWLIKGCMVAWVNIFCAKILFSVA